MGGAFPRSTGRRAPFVAAVASMLLSLAAVPAASAEEDFRYRENQVLEDLGTTLDELDQSSETVVVATDALESAQAELSVAQTYLAETRGELAAAEALDRQLQTRLDATVRRLRAARAELDEGQADLAGQEDTLGQIAVQNYQSGDPDLLGLSMMLSSQDPTNLTGQLNSVQNVLDKESVTLARLKATSILLGVQQQKVADGRRHVALRRGEAAENLARKKNLETDAEAAEGSVADLSEMRAEARDAAVRMREADQEHLRGLQQERERISDLLEQKAEQARLAAAAGATAVAAAAAASAEGAVNPGNRASNGFLDYPVNTSITSHFGMRLHPSYHRRTLHDGTDFGAACGTPIRAAADGIVIATYYNAGYGNRLIIDNGFRRGMGLGTAYNHLSSDSTSVGEGVRRGDIIGYVGNTGYSTGCHLHFMVYENGRAVDSLGWL